MLRWNERALPLAELLIVGGLFWGIICGNGASEVAGSVLLDGFSWNEALRIAARNEAMFAHRMVRSKADLDSSVEGRQVGGHAVAELLVDHEQGCNQCEQQLYLSLLALEDDPASRWTEAASHDGLR